MDLASVAAATRSRIASSRHIARLAAAAAAGMMAAMISTTAHAGFIGMTMDVEYAYPTIDATYPYAVATPSTFTVTDPGVETTVVVENVTTLTVDFSDNTLRILFNTVLTSPTWSAASFNGLLFDTLDVFDFTSATIDATSSLAGFDASRVLLESGRLGLDWNGLSYVNGTFLQINFEGGNSVPEPGMLALTGTLLGLLALGRRRRV